MKQSGIDWIGEIPDDWKIEKAKHVFRQRFDKGNEITLQLLSPTQKFGVIPQTLYEELTTYSAVKLKEGTDLSTFKTVHKGDFCISLRSFQGGFEYSRYEGVVSPAYQIFYAIKEIDDEYYKYLFKDQTFISKINSYTMSLRDGKNIAFSDFGDTFIPLPPKATQQRIAEYLDSKCAQIDSIIEESKKSIEEYKAWKQSVIFEAVTGKKLNCKKKDSGIEWIGEIPDGWEVKRLKFASRNRIQKYTSDYGILNYFALENIESQSGRFIETENEYDISQSLICQKNDVVFGKLRPYLAKVYKVNELCCCSGEFAVFYDFEGCPSFFKYYFLSDGFIKIVDSSTYGTKMPRANIDFIKNMLVAIPSLPEQESIAKMLDLKCAQIDSLIAEKELLITDLTEYKKSLIFEVVTGKRSV